MSELSFRHDCFLLDACCVINLYASFQMKAILSTMHIQVVISDYVKEQEALTILGDPDDDVSKERLPVNLQPMIDSGLIELAYLDIELEAETYIDLAVDLDDGEAISSAIAIHRNWGICTDEKKAVSILERKAPQIQVISTPELMKHWSDSGNPSREEISEALKNIRHRARYSPNINHDLYRWWIQLENAR